MSGLTSRKHGIFVALAVNALGNFASSYFTKGCPTNNMATNVSTYMEYREFTKYLKQIQSYNNSSPSHNILLLLENQHRHYHKSSRLL